MSIVDEDLITLKQAENVQTANGDTLSRRQIHHLCTQGKLEAQKVGTIWLVSRKSIEAYKPEETGFTLIWKRRRETKALEDNTVKEAVRAAKARKVIGKV
jgi:hypothetical protein